LSILKQKVTCNGGQYLLSRKNSNLKSISFLEGKLDRYIQKFNITLSENQKIRNQIDILRKDKVIFENIVRKLDNEIKLKSTEIQKIIEQSNSYYMDRDVALAKTHHLKGVADKEHNEFQKEWKELEKLLENDLKMKMFVRKKEIEKKLGCEGCGGVDGGAGGGG
jgi:hypothetical protein